MTPKQKEFIKTIAKTLDIPVNLNMSNATASKWITEHLDQFKDTQRENELEDDVIGCGFPNQ